MTGGGSPAARRSKSCAVVNALPPWGADWLNCSASGTIVVINGPRFSTAAESRFLAAQGWHLENMTQMPECALARELTLSYANLSLVVKSHVSARDNPSELAEVPAALEVMGDHLPAQKRWVELMVELLPSGEERPQFIRDALKDGRWV